MNQRLSLFKLAFLLVIVVTSTQVEGAVHINSEDTGQAVIVPFYSVSNKMATYVSLHNTTYDIKAVKVHIKEAQNGSIITSFNIYLRPDDMWVMAMVNGLLGPHIISPDESCALGNFYDHYTPTQEDWLWENGIIEVFEMGVVEATDDIDANHIDCEALSNMWEDGGTWADDSEAHLRPASGGLHAEVTLLDVEQGHASNIPVIHLTGFYGDDDIQHTPVGAETPNLDSGTHDSLILLNGEAFTTRWPTGYEAVSALLMTTKVYNEYNVEPEVTAKTDWIVSFPTLFYHLNNDEYQFPFYTLEDGFLFATHTSENIHHWNREGESAFFSCPLSCPPPQTHARSLNHSVNNMVVFSENDEPLSGVPMLTGIGALNTHQTQVKGEQSEEIDFNSGKKMIDLVFPHGLGFFNSRGRDPVNDNIGHRYYGIPVVGFTYTRFTNANAQPGRLAQYAFVREHFGEQEVVITGQ